MKVRQHLIDQAVQANRDIEQYRTDEDRYQVAKASKDAATAQMTQEEFNTYCQVETQRRQALQAARGNGLAELNQAIAQGWWPR